MNAVQLLRRDGLSAHETLAEIEQQQRHGNVFTGGLSLSSSPSPSSASSNSENGAGNGFRNREHLLRDYHGEMEEYQRKLIQVSGNKKI